MIEIQKSEDGVKISWGLLWTVGSALAVLIFWGGVNLTNLTAGQSTQAETMTEIKALILSQQAETRALESRVRATETNGVRQDARFDALVSGLNEVKIGQMHLLELLEKRQGGR